MASIAASWSTVSSMGAPTRSPMASTRADRTEASNGVVDGDLRRGVADPLPATGDHPELEGEQLVEGEPAEGRVAVRERIRVVGLLDRPGDRHEPLLGRDLGGQVLRVGEPGLVERLADRRAEADRGEAPGQPVDRHDPPGMEQLRVVGDDLEFGVVEGQPAAEVLDLARHDDLGTDEQPALDEAPPEPGRVDAPGVVLESRDRPLGPAAEAGLDAHVADGGLGRDDRPVRHPAEVARPCASRAGRRSAVAGGTAGRGPCRSRA